MGKHLAGDGPQLSSPAVGRRSVLAVRDAAWSIVQDSVVREVHLVLRTEGDHLARIACSPHDLEDLIHGFLFTHGVITAATDIVEIRYGGSDGSQGPGARVFPDDPELVANVVFRETTLAHRAVQLLADLSFVASGCGQAPPLSVSDAAAPQAAMPGSLKTDSITALGRLIQNASPIFAATGGVHAAALVSLGELTHLADPRDAISPMVVREDIGRHNSVDKVIGWCLLNGHRPAEAALVVTGRLSADLVHKAMTAGIMVVVSRSAPTDAAVELAESAGITLIGFARQNRMNVYSNWWRLRLTKE